MKLKIGYWMLAAAALSLTACVYDRDLPDADPEPVVLRLRLSAQSVSMPATRADGHATEEALDAENYIAVDADDYRILLFDGAGRFLQDVDAAQKWLVSDGTVAKDTYRLTLTGPVELAAEEVQVLVLTNWEGFSPAAQYPVLDGADELSRIYPDAADAAWQFTMPLAADGKSSWRPEIAAKRGVPMFGVSEIVPLSAAREPSATDVLDGQTVDGKVLDLGEIRLLRAVSKIEVLESNAADAAQLAGVSLSAYDTAGRFIPDVTANPDWGVEKTQVSVPSLPAGAHRSTAALQFFQVPGTAVWRAYVPEMDLRTARPELTFTLSGGERKSIALDNPAAPGTLVSLLRNHIYRYVVSISGGAIILDVVPYDETVLDPVFGK